MNRQEMFFPDGFKQSKVQRSPDRKMVCLAVNVSPTEKWTISYNNSIVSTQTSLYLIYNVFNYKTQIYIINLSSSTCNQDTVKSLLALLLALDHVVTLAYVIRNSQKYILLRAKMEYSSFRNQVHPLSVKESISSPTICPWRRYQSLRLPTLFNHVVSLGHI